jgi:hypothetical protein
MSEELLPCPFCGTENTDVGFVAHTDDCYLMRKYMGGKKRELIISWNKRPIEDALIANIDVLRAAIGASEEKYIEQEKIIEQLSNIRDLLRTSIPPVGTYTFEQWAQHKCDRASDNLTRMIDEIQGGLL